MLWNRSERPLDGFGETKPVCASGTDEALRDSDTMLVDDAAVEAVVHGGFLDALPDGTVHAGMSTVGIDAASRLTHAHRGAGAHMCCPRLRPARRRESGQILDCVSWPGGSARSRPPVV